MTKNVLVKSGSVLLRYVFIFTIFSCLNIHYASANIKQSSFQNVEPPHWWVGMPDSTLEILVHQKNIALNTFEIESKSAEVKLTEVKKFANPNYVVLKVSLLRKAIPQDFKIKCNGKAGKFQYNYSLFKRSSHKRGLDQSDMIYLITPDRFANGDPTNDSFADMQQKIIDRTAPYQRHGGDIQGIIDHLDYIQELGMTAVWPSPLLENDQPLESYHGYAITNHYKIDKRFGTNELYGALSDSLHRRGMKMIMDVVYNHIGDRHFLYQDIPDSSWFHFWDTYTQTTYRATTLMDPYASKKEKEVFLNGWFDTHMPDLNQKNETLAKYLIQQTLWWIEEYDIDALRIDTYAYPDPDFMIAWGREVKEAFPDIFLFGETWVHGFTVQGWFKSHLLANEENFLDGLTDFQIHYAINEALTQEQDWTGGISKLYYTLASDYIYENPGNMVTFLDNHDVPRFFGFLNGDVQKLKTGLALLFTLRGIPSLYYGTEILMRETDGHGKIREDFPGGWKGDALNKFNRENRSPEENEIFDYIQALAKLRKENSAINQGKTTQFIPTDGLYVFFRHHEDNVVMVVVNTSQEVKRINASYYNEVLRDRTEMVDLDGNRMGLDDLQIEGNSSVVLIDD